MRKNLSAKKGTVHRLVIESQLLKNNWLKDPNVRELIVYTPPDYDSTKPYPVFMDLAGYTGSGQSHANWKPFGLSLPERLDTLISSGKMGPVVAVLPDCFTSLGGNQYINSTATGPYMDYLIDEVIPFIEQRFSVIKNKNGRAVFGKSSGGYGSMIHGLRRPDVWGAIACHSGDAYFEYVYLQDMPALLNVLLRHSSSVKKFLEHVYSKEKLKSDEAHALMSIGMAAHYDPDPTSELGFHLPIDLHTGEINWDRWQIWLQHDPVRLLEKTLEAARSLRGLFIDCGTRDQYKLLWGARMLNRRLLQNGIKHEYQEFDDDHSDIDYRMNESLPYLYRSLSTQ
ncbi:MAG: hypothetical protein KA436_10710 [Oligoflexales bacterium]|nr:hypothetical protein [Oligoflexales bacterium]